ncbi:phage/plasmid primase, P4 family [Micromonospora rubida]|uniref:phage/plasmid primase, P4 family n=1 Tax=Micromonospora rubida TaxID=2697657 RepID=UPI001377545A|nr:phage/plasmid primase, P4 family [Micromonospora rubida]NBE80337.1 hypothetical protein [Micromonospora rubida]
MTQARDAALAWHDAGFCVLPAKTDGSKAPAVGSWTQYQTTRPDRDQVTAWFAGNHPGLGIICGAVSGGLEMLELEGRAVAEGALDEVTRLLTDADLTDLWMRITAGGYAERTPSGGLHFLYRVDGPVPGNTKLANRPARDDELTDDERALLARHPHRVITRGLAETRGEGGYVVVAPSNGTTHPTGKPWELTYGTYGQVPTITSNEREHLHRAFRSLDTMPAPSPTPARPALQVVRPAGTVTPGDDFEARTGWDDELLLGGAGWSVCSGTPGSYCEWRRSGKTDPGPSATTGKDPGRDRLYVFSSSTEFDTEVPYTKFGAYALLHHGGDHRAAARELARLGYGTPLERANPAAEQRAAIADLLPPASAARVLAAVDGTAARVLKANDAPTDLYAEMKLLADAGEEERQAKARDLIRRVARLDAADQQTWRDAIRQVVPAITKGDFDAIIRNERRAEKERAKEVAEQLRQQRYLEKKQNAATHDRLIPAPADPMAVARALVERLPATNDIPHLTWWRGDFYEWNGTRWAVQRDASINRWLYLQTENAIFDTGEEFGRWAPNIAKIGNLREAIGSAVLARPWDEDDEKCIAITNGVLDVANRTLHPHTPQRFNLASLPFAYDPEARCPKWRAFLAEVLPADEEAQAFLGEWFGYVVSGRTDLQKIASLFGAKRSGKGTIARILESLLGPESVAAVRLASLTGDFGEQPLIGKSLAVLSDINWSTRDVGEAVEIMKAISGEDSRDVNRKNRETWHGRLGVRFMALGNDMPKFTDASGALAGRMIHVRFRVSFYGKENPNLTKELLGELPGILNWALDGLDRLTERGRFKPPASSEESEREILRLTSPVYGFIDDRAALDPEAPPVLLDDLFAVYKEWCADEEGRDRVSTKAVFARDLRSAGNGSIQVDRKMVDGVRTQRVYGLAPLEPDGFKVKNRWLGGDAL